MPTPAALSAAAVQAKLALIDRRFAVKDPFEAQLGQSSATVSARQPLATAPAVKTSQFVAKDPFKAQLGLASGDAVAAVPALATAPPVSKPKLATVSTKAPTSGYIVVLRSLDTKAAGLRELKNAHAQRLRLGGAALLLQVHDAAARLLGRLRPVPDRAGRNGRHGSRPQQRLPVRLPADRKAVTAPAQVTPTPNR